MPQAPQSPGSTPESLVGAVIGDRYRIERLLDEGAMGRVYVGEHIHMRKRVAVKILRPELTRVPEVMARFEREAMAAAHIAHPNVATATDFGKLGDGSVYLVLEFVEGHTLRVEINKGPLGSRRALSVARQIAEALAAAHSLSIVHRDLKPENVMLVERAGAEDLVKVLDFGVAKVPIDIAETRPLDPAQGALVTKTGMVFGTPDYMAPEQALGQAVDGRADLYSLGVVFYEMLAGKRPFKNEHDFGILGQQLSGSIEPIAQRSPGVEVPSAIEQLVLQLLHNDAKKRIQSASELCERIDWLSFHELPQLFPEEFPPRSGLGSGPIDRLSNLATEPAPPPLRPAPRRPLSERFGALRRWSPDWEVFGVVAVLVGVGFAGAALWRSEFWRDETPTAESDVASAAQPEPAQPTAAASADTAPRATSESEAPAPDVLGDAQVEEALKAGTLAVDALLKRYPEDGRAHLALARRESSVKQWSKAVEASARALQLTPELATDKHLAALLWRAVQVNTTKDAALELLRGPMAARGADIMYDLAVTRGVRPDLAKAATEWLDTRAFERASTKEASIAAALFRAKNCKVRLALVKRAENVGDRRSAELLKTFNQGKGCAADEEKPCNACLVDAPEVAQALAAIESRAQPPPEPEP